MTEQIKQSEDVQSFYKRHIDDFYIIAIYGIHCSVSNINYYIAILNKDKAAKCGLRLIFREGDNLYNSLIDKLESQDLDIDSLSFANDVHGVVLQYPIKIKYVFCCSLQDFFNIMNLDITQFTTLNDSLYLNCAYINNSLIEYSLEAYSMLYKGNYHYSTLRYQKYAINELINKIRHDFDNKTNNYFQSTPFDKIKCNIELPTTDNMWEEMICTLVYPDIGMKRTIRGITNISDFVNGLAITTGDNDKYGVIDIRGNILLKNEYKIIQPLRICKDHEYFGNCIYTYATKGRYDEDEQYEEICFINHNNSFQVENDHLHYDKVFYDGEYELLFCYLPHEDEDEYMYNEFYKYESCILYINKNREYIRDYTNIKSIKKSVKDSYYELTKINREGKNTLTLVELNKYGRLVEIINQDTYSKFEHLFDKFWIVWYTEESHVNNYPYLEYKNLDIEDKEIMNHDPYYDGKIIEKSRFARIFHESQGFLSDCGEYQCYLITKYNDERVLILFSASYSKGEEEPYGYSWEMENEESEEIWIEKNDNCTVFFKDGQSYYTSYRNLNNDEDDDDDDY